jgi:hypothetical protein
MKYLRWLGTRQGIVNAGKLVATMTIESGAAPPRRMGRRKEIRKDRDLARNTRPQKTRHQAKFKHPALIAGQLRVPYPHVASW